MERMIAPGISAHLRCIAILAVASIVLTACATQQPTQSPTRVEIQQDVGFTITEEAGVETTVRTDYEEAVSLLEQGRNEEGIAILETVAETTPHLSAPRIDLGIAYRRIGNLEAAERNLLRALESNPDHPIAHNELGIVYRETGRFRQARASYEAALAVYPGFHYARRNLAILCDLYLADLDCALENYQAYMNTVPSDDEASMWIADIENRLNKQE